MISIEFSRVSVLLVVGCAIFALFCNAPIALAATYHVDSNRGDDKQDGVSPQAAWRSLDRANALELKPGDSLLFAADSVFQGQLKPRGEGAETQPITIGMYGRGKTPRIEGNGQVNAAVHLYNTQNITVQDLHLTNKGNEPGKWRRGLFVQIKDYGVARNIVIRRLTVTDVNGERIKKLAGGGILFENTGEKVRSCFDGLTIENNYVSRTERNGITGNSGYSAREKWFPSTRVVIRNNLLEEVPGDGIVPIGCDGALIEGNVIRKGAPLKFTMEISAAAGIWPWSCDNTLIQYNEVSEQRQDSDGQGFDSDWNCRGTIIQYNYSHENYGGFLLVCNDGKAKLPYSVGNTGTIIRYNVSFNDGLRHDSMGAKPSRVAPSISFGGAVSDVQIEGNVIIVPRKLSADVDDHIIGVHNWNGFANDVRISNNVFIAEGPARFDVTKGKKISFSDNKYFGPITYKDESFTPLKDSPIAEPFQHPGNGLDKAMKILDGVKNAGK